MTMLSQQDAMPPEESTPAVIRELLAHFDLNGVGYRASPPGNARELCITLRQADISRVRALCRTLPSVKLLREVVSSGGFQVFLRDGAGAAGQYCAVTVLPAALPARPSFRAACSGALRRTQAWLRPNGLFCVILGPDGVGKSTTIEYLQRELRILFGPCRKQRWRPGVIRKVKADGLSRMPHAKRLRGGITSVLALLGFAVDFAVGYEIWTRPAMARSEAILFDRYFHDLLIDPKRYRYGGPMWLARLIARVIPPRNALFIILDADDQVILSRKQELPADELRRQRAAYATFGAHATNAMVVRTEKPVEEIVAEIIEGIVTRLALKSAADRRTPRRATVSSGPSLLTSEPPASSPSPFGGSTQP